MKNYLQILGFFIVLTIITSCNNDTNSNHNVDPDKVYTTEVVKQIVNDEQIFRSIDDVIDLSFNFYTGEYKSSERGCRSISFEDKFWKTPNVMTIDYGVACDRDGDIYEGKVIISYNKFMNRSGAVKSVSFENFKINGDHIQGELITRNLGRNADEYYVFQKEVKDGRIDLEDGTSTTLNLNNFYTFAFEGPFYECDQKNIEITGGSNGVSLEGETFNTFIITPIIMSLSCKCVNAGFETFTIDSETYTVDYGDSTCDAISIITLPNGMTEESDICE